MVPNTVPLVSANTRHSLPSPRIDHIAPLTRPRAAWTDIISLTVPAFGITPAIAYLRQQRFALYLLSNRAGLDPPKTRPVCHHIVWQWRGLRLPELRHRTPFCASIGAFALARTASSCWRKRCLSTLVSCDIDTMVGASCHQAQAKPASTPSLQTIHATTQDDLDKQSSRPCTPMLSFA